LSPFLLFTVSASKAAKHNPHCSASKVRKSEDDNYWVVGLNSSKLFCIVCKSPEIYPSVGALPPLGCYQLSITCLTLPVIFCFHHRTSCLFQVMPKPVLTLLDLSFPLASSDLGAGDLENEFIMSNLQLSQVHGSFPLFKSFACCILTFFDVSNLRLRRKLKKWQLLTWTRLHLKMRLSTWKLV